MTPQVAVYVQSKYAKPAYTVESYNVRAWPGLEMVCHALRLAGIEVDYCSSATAGRYKVVLVSITSGCDWYTFVGERLAWPKTVHPVHRRQGGGVFEPARTFNLKQQELLSIGASGVVGSVAVDDPPAAVGSVPQQRELGRLHRGSGKTTLARLSALWAVLGGYRPFVCLIGGSQERAIELLTLIREPFTTRTRCATRRLRGWRG